MIRQRSPHLLTGTLLLAVGVSGCAGGSTAPVEMNSGPQGHCFGGGVSAQEWKHLTATATEFGIDYFTIKGRSTVHVTRVSLTGGNGKLLLEGVTFVPGGGVGNGFTFGDRRASADPENWLRRLDGPTSSSHGSVSLPPLHATDDEIEREASADQYQLVVGVTPTADPSSAARAVIDYSVDGHHYRALGQAFLRFSASDLGSCDGPAG